MSIWVQVAIGVFLALAAATSGTMILAYAIFRRLIKAADEAFERQVKEERKKMSEEIIGVRAYRMKSPLGRGRKEDWDA